MKSASMIYGDARSNRTSTTTTTASSSSSSSSILSPLLFFRLVFDNILPSASRWPSGDHIITLIRTPQVEGVFEHFKEFLLLTFQIYAG
jgi:hypothetical protein